VDLLPDHVPLLPRRVVLKASVISIRYSFEFPLLLFPFFSFSSWKKLIYSSVSIYSSCLFFLLDSVAPLYHFLTAAAQTWFSLFFLVPSPLIVFFSPPSLSYTRNPFLIVAWFSPSFALLTTVEAIPDHHVFLVSSYDFPNDPLFYFISPLFPDPRRQYFASFFSCASQPAENSRTRPAISPLFFFFLSLRYCSSRFFRCLFSF